jgi:biopolymer transport protein ExbD
VNFQKHVEEAKPEVQIAPLIDVVFLLLIYFMVTARLIKKEGDISFKLPAEAKPNMLPVIPVEVVIQITVDGAVMVDGVRYSPNDKNLDQLVTALKGRKRLAESQSTPFYVNLLPNEDSVHERVIDVMDACAAAGVENLSFSKAP